MKTGFILFFQLKNKLYKWAIFMEFEFVFYAYFIPLGFFLKLNL